MHFQEGIPFPSILETKFLSFDHIKELYPRDVDFSSILSESHQGASKTFTFSINIFSKVRDFAFPKVP